MKTKISRFPVLSLAVVAMLAILNAPSSTAHAQGTRYFRISGPAATKILAFRPDGSLVWSNALAGTNYTVQTVTSLPGGTSWVDYVRLPATNRVNTNWVIDYHPSSGMVLIPADSFTMGNCMSSSEEGNSSERPLHTVYVSAFYMDKYDVTYALWVQVYDWATNHGYSFDNAGTWNQGPYNQFNEPEVCIGWYDCVKWCNARSEMEGLTPAYYYTSWPEPAIYRTGQVNVDNSWVEWNAGYRLPTEAEWEKAARGGLSGQRFPWGNTISWSQANYWGNPLSVDPEFGCPYDFATTNGFDPTFVFSRYPYTNPVDYFAPNGYGLYDMAGNVWQWC